MAAGNDQDCVCKAEENSCKLLKENDVYEQLFLRQKSHGYRFLNV